MGERDKQNKHAYDKVTAEGKGEKYSSTKKSSRQAMLQFLRRCKFKLQPINYTFIRILKFKMSYNSKYCQECRALSKFIQPWKAYNFR